MCRCCNSSQFILRLAGSEPSDIHISQVLCLQGSGSELFLVHPVRASEASDTALPARHQLILYPQCCSNPNPHRTTAVLIFHAGLITQFYDNDNVLQIATRQLIQWTWISGQLAVVLESFNHHVISHLFNLNTHTHTHKCDLWFEFSPQVLRLLSTHIQCVCLHLGLPSWLTAMTTAVVLGEAWPSPTLPKYSALFALNHQMGIFKSQKRRDRGKRRLLQKRDTAVKM